MEDPDLVQGSSPRSFVSTGVAKVKSMSRLTPTIKHLPKPMTSTEILETHRLPPLDLPDTTSTSEGQQDEDHDDDDDSDGSSTAEQISEVQKNISEEGGNHNSQDGGSSRQGEINTHSKRQSIIDPSTVRLSFAGTISNLEAPLLLEEGLQKLYRLYQQATAETAPLPYSVSITEVPLMTIADRLERQLQDQHNALEQCGDNLATLGDTVSLARRDLRNLELHYCLARQEANMRAMTPREARLRIEWLQEEIVKINTDKEVLFQQHRDFSTENDQLKERLTEMKKVQKENDNLRQLNTQHQVDNSKMKEELAEVNDKLKDLQLIFQSMPSTLRKLWMRNRVISSSETCQENIRPDVGRRRSSKFSFY